MALTNKNLREAAETIGRVGLAVRDALDNSDTSPLLGLNQADVLKAARQARTLFDTLREHDELRDEITQLKGVLGVMP